MHNDDETIMIDDENDGNDGSMMSVYMRWKNQKDKTAEYKTNKKVSSLEIPPIMREL